MLHPWEVPHLDRDHQALPLGEGWWRGPDAGEPSCRRLLEERGIRAGRRLPDGSGSWRLPEEPLQPDLGRAAEDPRDPRARAAWIEARLHAARLACAREPEPPVWMRILNLTPDSFSDGGELTRAGALAQALAEAREQGAAWLDLGAESTRPGAAAVAAEVQIARLEPALEAVSASGIPWSVDTRSARVAAFALEAGARMVNDVSGLSDPELAPLVAAQGAELVLMHMRGTPEDMQERTAYRFLLGEVADELARSRNRALRAGVQPERIVLDPGFGFAKTARQSLELLGRLGALRALGHALLAGPSRKSFLGLALGERPPRERDGGTAGAAALAAAQGAEILRLHRGGAVWEAALAAAAAAREARRAQADPLPALQEARA